MGRQAVPLEEQDARLRQAWIEAGQPEQYEQPDEREKNLRAAEHAGHRRRGEAAARARVKRNRLLLDRNAGASALAAGERALAGAGVCFTRPTCGSQCPACAVLGACARGVSCSRGSVHRVMGIHYW